MDKTTNSSQNTGGREVSQDLASDSFISTLQSKLLSQSEAISSASTGIEKSIDKAIAGVNKANVLSTQRLESEAERNKGYLYDAGKTNLTGANEARRGFATNTGILKLLAEDTEKQVRDLDTRKQELILQGESEAAGQIASLQLKKLEYQEKARQETFNNLLSLSNFGLSALQEKRQAAAQRFTESSAIGNIALEFGLDVNPGDTLESIITRAQPFAEQKRALELSKAQKELTYMNAQIAKLNKDMEIKSDDDIEALAKASFLNPGVMQRIEDANLASKVTNKMSELEPTMVTKPLVLNAIAAGNSLDEIVSEIQNSSTIMNKDTAIAEARKLYNDMSPSEAKKKLGDTTGSPFLDIVYGGTMAVGGAVKTGAKKTAWFFGFGE